jgi:DNA-binding transcriptional ArsR family regulator
MKLIEVIDGLGLESQLCTMIDTDHERLASAFKVLGHPLRLQIIQYLHASEEACVGDICENLNAEQSLVSHHLFQMRSTQLVKSRRVGKTVCYCVDSELATSVAEWLVSHKEIAKGKQ